MSTKQPDPWTTPDGFERYIGPAADDGFTPMDSRATDLADYLRGEIQGIVSPSPRRATLETVTLANGAQAQLSQRSAETWELTIHLGRDFYRVFSASSRRGVLEAADADNRARLS
jgi:hypothetical protein